MNKTFRLILTLAVMLAVVLPLGVYASADDLPHEKVGYGFGMPDAAAVPAHDLTDDGLTIGGVTFKTRIENGKVYIRVVDLLAVKLLQENTDVAEELGLDYDGLYIERGLIFVKEDGKTEDEISGIQEKLAELKAQSAAISVSVGDEFTLASGGADRLVVEVAGFVYAPKPTQELPPPEPTEPPLPEPTQVPFPPEESEPPICYTVPDAASAK